MSSGHDRAYRLEERDPVRSELGADHEPSQLMDLIELNHDLGARIHQLEEAVHSRDRIGIAAGLLMARDDTTAEDAFAALRRASQDSGRQLRDVAEDIISTWRPRTTTEGAATTPRPERSAGR